MKKNILGKNINKKIKLFKVFNPPKLDVIFNKILRSGYVAEGEYVEKFKNKLGIFLNNPKVVLFNSCTSALTAAYQIAGIKKNSKVISTPLTCVAANTPLLHLGAKIIWCDVDPKTGMMSLKHLEKLVDKTTKAIVPLHKDGEPFEIDKLRKILKRKKSNAKIIEDAAHAFGAKYKNKKIGNHGDMIAFSFQAIKQIHTIDGGALVCRKISDYKKAKKLKWLGIDRDVQNKKKSIWMNDIKIAGYKANMTNIPASIGIEQLKYIHSILKKHNLNGRYLDKKLSKIKNINILKRNNKSFSTYWLYSFTSPMKKKIEKNLNNKGIESVQIHPRNDQYSIFKKYKKKLPNLDKFQSMEVNIPCGWWVSKKDLNLIVDVIKKSV